MGNSPKLFYYRDQTGQAVGPLPLSEIERFVKAGVLRVDVQVREDTHEEWQSLETVKSHEEIPVATKVAPASPPSESQTNENPDRNEVRKEWEEAAQEIGGLVKSEARGAAGVVWGCLRPVLYLILVVIILRLFLWFLDNFISMPFEDGLF